jgi:hypothetical protein
LIVPPFLDLIVARYPPSKPAYVPRSQRVALSVIGSKDYDGAVLAAPDNSRSRYGLDRIEYTGS